MNAPTEAGLFDETGSEVVENKLPPTIFNPLEALIGEYEVLKKQLEFISTNAKKDSVAFSHFLHGNSARGVASFNVESIFDINGGMRSLDATYWSKAMSLTKTMDVFSAKKRNEWTNMIHDMKTPAFERQTVIDTLVDLMSNRDQFFSDKVDGVYRNLSRNHLTNSRFGFTDRMIIEYCIHYGSPSNERMNFVSDLRSCISTLNGKGLIDSWTTYYDVERLMTNANYGKWHMFDGGAFRLRIYKKGTVHIEIHPEMSWKLNQVLASMHPGAIPSELREAPKKKFKEFILRDDVIDMDVRSALNGLVRFTARNGDQSVISKTEFSAFRHNQVLLAKVESILKYLGGRDMQSSYTWDFPYAVRDIIREIVRTGVIPNSVEYQYYPTPEALAVMVNDLAEVSDEHTILEPSAGMGSLLRRVANKSLVTCVDVSSTHCFILKEMGFTNVIEGDFLALDNLGTYDRVLLNPPFSCGRAEMHLQHAWDALKVGGILVAVLPGSMHNKHVLKNADCEFLKVDDAGFEGTKVTVTVLKAIKKS